MFKSIFSKTMYEKRWFILGWSIGVIAMSILMMAFYHSFSQGGFDQLYKNIPKSFQGVVGNLSSLKTVPGYVSQEVFALRIPLLVLIMGVILFSASLAGDENEGTLQTLLAQPVSRTKVFIEKYSAVLLVSFIICFTSVIGVLIGLLFIHEHMSLLRLSQAAIGVWLLAVMFGSLGYSLGAITGKRALSGSIAGLVTFSSYILTSFAPSVSWLASVDKFSPFHYYNKPSIAEVGLKGSNTLLMLAVTLIPLAIAYVIFKKRDIYQR